MILRDCMRPLRGQVMENTRANARRVKEGNGDKEVLFYSKPSPSIRSSSRSKRTSYRNATLEKFRASMKLLAQALTVQSNSKRFLRMNPPDFSASKVEKDPNGFIGEVYKVPALIGMHSTENTKLSAYQLKEFSQIWNEQLKDSRLIGVGLIEWETFKLEFLDRIFPQELREA
ncbi:hypothetical protein EJD97_013351 [Solanum chilense]|uniref:Retrotransposon gag domain-containing protein n=1 Tax=Solanum chilense TaxID=4083 RepID=A0A6N2AFE0_SOLCI|nr:hypothetical protein EJD97_013351 [Solanum chilense]